MINQSLLLNYPSDFSLDRENNENFLFSIIENLLDFSENIIIITDNRFRVVYANRKLLLRGENVLQKFKLKENHLLNEIPDIKRIISFEDEKIMFSKQDEILTKAGINRWLIKKN